MRPPRREERRTDWKTKAYSPNGTAGRGIYVSPFDAIPADYGLTSPEYPDGTFVLALLLTRPGAGKFVGNAPQAGVQQPPEAMTWYHLGSMRPGYIGNGSRPRGGPPRGRMLAAPAAPAAPPGPRVIRTGGLIPVTYRATKPTPKGPNGLPALRVPQGLVLPGATAGNNQGARIADAVAVHEGSLLLPLGLVVAQRK